jgi:hypothetical protein
MVKDAQKNGTRRGIVSNLTLVEGGGDKLRLLRELVAITAAVLRIQDWRYTICIRKQFDDAGQQGGMEVTDPDNKAVRIDLLRSDDVMTLLHEMVHVRFVYLTDPILAGFIEERYHEGQEQAINATAEVLAMVPEIQEVIEKF